MIISREKDIPTHPMKSVSRVVGADLGIATHNGAGLALTNLGITATEIALLVDTQSTHTAAGATDWRSASHHTHRHGGNNRGEAYKCG